MGWVDTAGNIQVGSYDHATKARRTVTLRAALQINDHANPSILVRPDGRLMVFYSKHSGPQMYYRLSTRPEDIASWGLERTVGTNTAGTRGYTYPNPMQLSAEANKIYLFWRGGNWQPTFSTSTDGLSWSTARTLIQGPEGHRPYVKYVSDGEDEIHFVFTEGHPAAYDNSLYYARYKAGAFYRADGTRIGDLSTLPLRPSQADLVYNAKLGGGKAWDHDIALDSSGHPVMVYAAFASTTDHRYRYARWTGSEWLDREIVPAGKYINGGQEPFYSGGISLDHEDPSVVYLSRVVGAVHEVERWTTPDKGVTWSHRAITANSTEGNYRPVSPRGLPAGAETEVIWMQGPYHTFTDYDTRLMTLRKPRAVRNPAMASWGDGRLDLFALDGGTGRLLRKAYTDSWGG